MPWANDAAGRAHTAAVYGPEWRKARAIALKRAGERCEQCGNSRRLQVDHRVPVSQGGTHLPSNLQVLCLPCHRTKTANEGGGYRELSDPAPKPTTSW